jgi:hypothetical protein
LHIKDKDLLLQIKSFFNNVGYIYKINDNAIIYQVITVSDIISTIVPHFEKYPLITKKYSDFILFRNIVKLIDKKEHLHKDGFIKIVSYKASLNNGLSNKLKTYFPKLTEIERIKVNIIGDINFN